MVRDLRAIEPIARVKSVPLRTQDQDVPNRGQERLQLKVVAQRYRALRGAALKPESAQELQPRISDIGKFVGEPEEGESNNFPNFFIELIIHKKIVKY
jgi:hypothetical protein